MRVQVNTQAITGPYTDPTCWQNSTLRYVPPVDFPTFLAQRLGKAKIMRTWITLDEYWDYRTNITYPNFEIGKMRYPVEELHYPYDMAMIVPAPSGTRFRDYLISHSQNAQEYVNIYLRAHKVITALNEKHRYPIPLELGGFAQAHPLQSWSLMEQVMALL